MDLSTIQILRHCKCGIHSNRFRIWVSRYWHLGVVTFGDKIHGQLCVNPYGKSPSILIRFVSWWMQGGKHNTAIVHHRHNIHSATGNPIPPMPSNHIPHLRSHLLLASRQLANFDTYYSNSGGHTFNVSIYMLLYSSWCQSTGCSITMHLTFQTHKWPILFYW